MTLLPSQSEVRFLVLFQRLMSGCLHKSLLVFIAAVEASRGFISGEHKEEAWRKVKLDMIKFESS